jgi:diguanylate cyclase (GGDEF)-like protein
MMRERRTDRSVTLGGGALALAILAYALLQNARLFTTADWIVTGIGAACVCVTSSYALPIRGLRMRRAGLYAEAVFLDLSIVGPIFSLGGPVGVTAAALAFAAGFGAAPLFARSELPTDLLRHGMLRVLAALTLLPFAGHLSHAIRSLGPVDGSFAFAGLMAVAWLVFVVFASPPISSLAHHVPLLRIWQRILRDPRTWSIGAGNVVWATAVRAVMLQHAYFLAIVMWLPSVTTAMLLRHLDEQRAELHRLRLVRDAVQAMLGDRDPLPQINAILAALRVPSHDETVTVYAATGARIESWRTVTTLGPAPSSAGDELRRRILARLKFSGQSATTLRDEYYVTYAFAARSGGELHGAMVVHRRRDRPLSNEQMTQFGNAAFELAPLLRDMRSIAAAQSAATTDALTGLYNRATVIERLQSMLEEGTIGGRGAILLLDIDHFKTINDRLGHAAGDACLRKIGEIIRNTIRGGDVAGRIGGEEFLAIMPGAERETALAVGERLRLAIALSGMRYASGEPVTTSIGVATANAGEGADSLLARADRALYDAKNAGRNRISESVTEETA